MTQADARASILDRLIDEDPDLSRDAARSSSSRMNELRQAVERDLENLLNSRRPYLRWSPAATELSRSVFGVGVPDITDARADTITSRERLRQAFEQAIRIFEPRLSAVRVATLRNDDPADRSLRFRIEAVIAIGMADPIAFDSVMEPASGAVHIRRAMR